MDYKSILIIWFCKEIFRNEWDIALRGLFWLLQKNGGNFWILRDRGKGFFGRGEKVHFWKSQFQNLFQNSDFSNFAAIFVYMGFMNWIRNWIFLYRSMEAMSILDTLGPFGSSLQKSKHLLIYLLKFSQSDLQKYIMNQLTSVIE
jgi:hypothetical protein